MALTCSQGTHQAISSVGGRTLAPRDERAPELRGGELQCLASACGEAGLATGSPSEVRSDHLVQGGATQRICLEGFARCTCSHSARKQ